ncbi:hypothetical protein [Rhizobium mongolense]|uniref:Uncharacterized protein n=1 Tax=Rhizobium mongolense TaxID=57676 RepID=A0ABR6II71_9HYPH|nr:hypothetical protein [Rhizobium mongolense]MBB4227573.1 hypothetical protein [Rhizobium mongolense]
MQVALQISPDQSFSTDYSPKSSDISAPKRDRAMLGCGSPVLERAGAISKVHDEADFFGEKSHDAECSQTNGGGMRFVT